MEERRGERRISIHRKFGNEKEILFAASTFVKSSILWAPPGFSFCVDTIGAGEESKRNGGNCTKKESER